MEGFSPHIVLTDSRCHYYLRMQTLYHTLITRCGKMNMIDRTTMTLRLSLFVSDQKHSEQTLWFHPRPQPQRFSIWHHCELHLLNCPLSNLKRWPAEERMYADVLVPPVAETVPVAQVWEEIGAQNSPKWTKFGYDFKSRSSSCKLTNMLPSRPSRAGM